MVDPVVTPATSGAPSTPATPPAPGNTTQEIEGLASTAQNPPNVEISGLSTPSNSGQAAPLTLGSTEPLTLGTSQPLAPQAPLDLPGTEPSSTGPTHDPNSSLPNITEMETTLAQTGTLLPEIEVKPTTTVKLDVSPLAALQPEKIKESGEPETQATQITAVDSSPDQPAFHHIQLGNTQQHHFSQAAAINFPNLPYWIFSAIILFIQAVTGISQFLHFVFIQYPPLDQMVLTLQMAESELNVYMVKIGVLSFVVITSLVFALVMFCHNKLRTNIVFIGISFALILINFFVQNSYVLPHLIPGNPFQIPQVIQDITTPTQPQTDSNSY